MLKALLPGNTNINNSVGLNWFSVHLDSPFSISAILALIIHDILLTGLAASSLALMEFIFPCTARIVLLLKCKPGYASLLLKNRLGLHYLPSGVRSDSHVYNAPSMPWLLSFICFSGTHLTFVLQAFPPSLSLGLKCPFRSSSR